MVFDCIHVKWKESARGISLSAMEFPLLSASAIASFLVLAALLIIIYFGCLPASSKPNLPPGPRPWPLIGNLPFLIANASTSHRALARLSLQYGPIFTIWLGSVPALVVSSPALAKEFLITHDKNFSDRPKLGVCDALMYGQQNGMGLAHYGPKWMEIRRLFNLELLTQFMERQSREGNGDGYVDVRMCLSMAAANIIARLAFSTGLVDWTTGAYHELQQLIFEFNKMSLEVLIGDYIPCLGWLDVATLRRMRRLHRRMDEVLNKFIIERLREEAGRSKQDFLDVLLVKTDPEALDSVKSILLDLFGGGIHTSSIAVEWTMAELLRHLDKMKKLQAEIDEVVGGEKRSVQESEAARSPYLKAVMKEALGLHPPAPLLLPHASQEECKVVGGYTIPAKTRLMVNVWTIGNDPKLWDKPQEFIPERFLNNPIDILGRDYELLPFGSSRRICPGLPLALHLVSLFLANLVHSFHWAHIAPSVDMSDKSEGPLVMATPLRIIPKPRLGSAIPT